MEQGARSKASYLFECRRVQSPLIFALRPIIFNKQSIIFNAKFIEFNALIATYTHMRKRTSLITRQLLRIQARYDLTEQDAKRENVHLRPASCCE